MSLALQEAKHAASLDEVPIGAVIVFNQKVIAKAHNEVENQTDLTCHAEVLAYTAATNYLQSKLLHDCTLYVTLEPCPMCAHLLYQAQLSRLVIGAKDTKRGYSNFEPTLIHPKTEVITGILATDCADVLTRFFANKRK